MNSPTLEAPSFWFWGLKDYCSSEDPTGFGSPKDLPLAAAISGTWANPDDLQSKARLAYSSSDRKYTQKSVQNPKILHKQIQISLKCITSSLCLPCSCWFLHDKVNVSLEATPVPPRPMCRWFLLSYLLLVRFPMTIYSPTASSLHVFLLFPYSTVIYRTKVHPKQHPENMTPFHLGIISVASLQNFEEV